MEKGSADTVGAWRLLLAVDAIRDRLTRTPAPSGFCLFFLENMDMVEVAGHIEAVSVLRARIRQEIEQVLGQGAVLSEEREDGFLLALPPGERSERLREIDLVLTRLPEWGLDQGSYATSVTGRAGIVWLDTEAGPPWDPAALHRAALTALTAARAAQKMRMVWGEANRKLISDLELTAQLICDLPTAADENRLFLLAQEIVNLHPGAPRGHEYEILLQMHGRDGRSYAPGAFLQAAEQSRLIELIDNWVLHSMLVTHAPRLLEHPELRISINVAARSLSNPLFRSWLETFFTRGTLPPERVQLEITETSQIRDLHQAKANVDAARALGCRIALDDFGAGLSGFGYLRTFDPHCIKIDGSLIPHVCEPGHADARIVRSIITLAHDLGMEVVAEHVTNMEILQTLQEFGADKVQGFQLGRPGPLLSIFENRPHYTTRRFSGWR